VPIHARECADSSTGALRKIPGCRRVPWFNTGSGPAGASVLTWKLTPETVNSCWCLAWGDAPVAPLQPGGVATVDMCTVLKAQTSWLDDGITAKDLVFEVAQTSGGEFDLTDNTRTLFINCKA
jgi:hypothetical protein